MAAPVATGRQELPLCRHCSVAGCTADAELACHACRLTSQAPALVTAEVVRDLFAAGKRAICAGVNRGPTAIPAAGGPAPLCTGQATWALARLSPAVSPAAWPGRDHPADDGGLGCHDVGSQAGDAPSAEQRPRKRPTPLRLDHESASKAQP